MRLIGYVRVSDKSQESNTSLKDQERKLKAYCEAMGHRLVKTYKEVGSGKDTEGRPEFQEAMEALQQADGIIAVKLDRLARNTRDVLELVEDVLQPANKALVLLDLNVDTSTPTGRAMLTVMAAVATLKRDQINERCRNGRQAKKAEGGYIGGRVPYGYSLDSQSRLVPNPTEQAVLDIIRKRSRRGHTLYSIAKYLNDKGHPTKTGAKWSHVAVGKLVERLKAG